MSSRLLQSAVVLTAIAVLIAAGCLPEDPIEPDEVTGDVKGQQFTGVSGTAEGNPDDGYDITLVDDRSFSCDSTPTGSYLTVVVGQVGSEGRFDAAERVSFNHVEQNEPGDPNPEPADQGEVDIWNVDDDDPHNPRIEGQIDAFGQNSQVSGTFSVPICN